MQMRQSRRTFITASLVAAVTTASVGWLQARQNPRQSDAQAAASVGVDPDDIGGVVTGPRGPEAGVWVIAETAQLPTTFRRIVVTDDRGRYLLPDLPKVNYRVWV